MVRLKADIQANRIDWWNAFSLRLTSEQTQFFVCDSNQKFNIETNIQSHADKTWGIGMVNLDEHQIGKETG